MGAFVALREILQDGDFLKQYGIHDTGVQGKRLIIQGFGKVGYHFARYMVSNGAKLIGVVEKEGSIYNANGIDPEKLMRYRNLKSTIAGYPIADSFEDDSVLFQECDILAPAALEQAINKTNAGKINCKILIETAYGPTTISAEEILEARGIAILPDILVNGGGLIVSYFEYLKNTAHLTPGRLQKRWEYKSKLGLLSVLEDQLNIKFDPKYTQSQNDPDLKGPEEIDIVLNALEDVTINAVSRIRELSKKDKISLRMAAYREAILKIHEAYESTGYHYA